MKKRSPLLAVFFTVVIDLLGFGIVLPLLPLYADEYGASPVLIGLIFVAFSGMQFVTAPLWGRLSDRIGRRPVILWGLIGSMLSYVCFALAPLLPHPIAWLFVSRLTAGVFGGTISTAYAYIADVTTPEERGRGMALIGAAFGIGFTVGPAVGGVGHWLHPTVPGFAAAGFSLLAFLFALRNLHEPERTARARGTWLDLTALHKALTTPTIGGLLLLLFLTVSSFALMESTLGLLAKRVFTFDYWQVGLLFSYLGFWSALTQGYLVRKYLKKGREGTFARLGALVLGAGLLGLAFPRSVLGFALVAPLPVLGFAMILPAANALISLRTDPATQGEVLGVSQSLQSLARIVGPMLGLSLFGVSVPLPFYVGAAVMGVAVFLAGTHAGPADDLTA